ncbi:hypothetical protein CR513_44287, partial [Mucuna pruriens]
MLKKGAGRLQEYAQRWCELAAQVQLPIIEREMVTMFIDTLPTPYYDKVVGNIASNFIDLIVVGKRIELGIRRGKFTQTGSNVGFTKKPVSEKQKGETNVVMLKANTVRHKMATKDACPNSHAMCRATSPPTGVEAGRNNPSQVPRATIPKEL